MSIITTAGEASVVAQQLVDADVFRRSSSRIPTAVTVITAPGAHGPVGMTVGSFAAVSQTPPLFSFFAKRSSATAAQIVAAGVFTATVLTRGQEAVCTAFASAAPRDRFAGVRVQTCCNGAPRVTGGLVWTECEIDGVLDVGDHIGIVGRAVHLEFDHGAGHPLTFYRHKLCRLDPGAGRHLPSEGLAWW